MVNTTKRNNSGVLKRNIFDHSTYRFTLTPVTFDGQGHWPNFAATTEGNIPTKYRCKAKPVGSPPAHPLAAC